jgi:hypothetical protein
LAVISFICYLGEKPLISYSLAIISFVSLIFYLIQFVVYTNAYVKKSFKFNKSIFRDKKDQIKNMITASNFNKVALIFFECAIACFVLMLGIDIAYKLTYGINEIPLWRQSALNQSFPDDQTKVWTELKAAAAADNRAMGNPHSRLYETLGR